MIDSKEPREFEVARRAREVGIGGSGLELTLRNNLNQRALARECAEWIRKKGVFKSAKMPDAIQPGGTYVVEKFTKSCISSFPPYPIAETIRLGT